MCASGCFDGIFGLKETDTGKTEGCEPVHRFPRKCLHTLTLCLYACVYDSEIFMLMHLLAEWKMMG